MQNSKLIQYKLHHVVFWMLVFGIWYMFRYQDYSQPEMAVKVTFIKVIDLAVMVYVTNYVLIPQLFYKKKYGWFVLAFIVLIVASSLLKMNILGRIMHSPALMSLSGNWKTRIYDNVLPHFFLVAAGAAIKVMTDYARLQQRMAETAKEKAEAELNFLKSQINPHFLFNSLNSVYFLIDKQNTDARESLHKFSEMLRYQLYEAKGEKIPVEKEISYLRDYVDLQKIRKDESYEVSFNCSPSVNSFSIEPLLLVPFVENAFKHISSHTHQPNFINIALEYINDNFIFSVENSKEAVKVNDPYSGIGLTNVKRRLELLYPGKYDLSVTDAETIFTIHLKLKIK